ncbi:hypothetical protein H9Q69_008159 [Fusarium xylarioides]|nr:hypothetical protein H9Q69_008159 [Fusarium xylarioides]
MFQPISITLTTAQTCIAGVVMMIAFLNFGWTIYSKMRDWQEAADERDRKKLDNATEAARAARTVPRQEFDELKNRLDTALNELQTLSGTRNDSINDKLNGLEAKLKTMEDTRCRCNATRFQELVDDVQTLKSEKAQLEKDAITKATDKLTEATKALTESYQSAGTMHDNLEKDVSGLKDTISNIKGCQCREDKQAVIAEPLRRVQSSKSFQKAGGRPKWRV